MKALCAFLLLAIPCVAQHVTTTCSASPTIVSAGQTITLTAKGTVPGTAKAHWEWKGRGIAKAHYVNEAQRNQSVVTLDTTGLEPGNYVAMNLLTLNGYRSRCMVKFTVK